MARASTDSTSPTSSQFDQLGLRPAPGATAAMSFPAQLSMMTARNLKTLFREPSIIPGLLIGVFFLVIYEGALGGAAEIFLAGQSYLGFILPLSVLSTSLSGGGIAGDAVIRDIKNGYFDKLLLTPISRPALLLAPMLSTAVVLTLQAAAIIGVGLLMGLRPVTGAPGLLVLLGFALLFGLALAGFVVSVALLTNSSSATTSASFLVFPFTFLTTTFTPLELLDGWIRVAAELNPITYLLDATRGLLNTGWDGPSLLCGLLVTLALDAAMFTCAFFALRRRTARR